ncbi:MAG: hypothetical protein ACRDL2_07500 [Gaiellaceae bacterium]
MDEFSERDMLDAVLTSIQYVHVKLDHILDILGDDGEEEEDETDG